MCGGFVVEFSQKPDIDLDEVEKRIHEYIALDLPISYHDENHILIGEQQICSRTKAAHASHKRYCKLQAG